MSWQWVDKAVRDERIKAVWFGGTRKIPAEEFERIKREGFEQFT
jgi:hypothetical protein